MNKAAKPFRSLAAFALLFHLGTADLLAQGYPNKPIRLILGFPPGGAIDLIARVVSTKMSGGLGQPVVVENRGGAGGAIAAEAVVRAAPDGYTLLMLSTASTTLPALRKLPYDMQRDLAPISMVATGSSLLVVHPSVPARNVKELLALARSRPGKMTYASSGIGSATHLMAILFTQMGKVDVLHVPFTGSAGSSVAVASGEVDMSFFNPTAALPLMEAGKIKVLGTIGSKRIASLPNVPTLDESGLPGYDYSLWYGLFAPTATSKEITTRISALLDKELNTAEVRAMLAKQGGLEPRTNTPDQFAAIIRRDLELNAKLVKLSGAKAE